MTARLALLLAAWLACTAAAAQPPSGADDVRIEDWIGRVDVPLPSGYREIAGHCIARGSDVCHQAVSVLRDEQAGTHVVLATRELIALDGSRPGGARPTALVTDALEVAALDEATAEAGSAGARVPTRGTAAGGHCRTTSSSSTRPRWSR